jgi:hypothetical protein
MNNKLYKLFKLGSENNFKIIYNLDNENNSIDIIESTKEIKINISKPSDTNLDILISNKINELEKLLE